VWFTTNRICVKNNTIIYVARASNSKRDWCETAKLCAHAARISTTIKKTQKLSTVVRRPNRPSRKYYIVNAAPEVLSLYSIRHACENLISKHVVLKVGVQKSNSTGVTPNDGQGGRAEWPCFQFKKINFRRVLRAAEMITEPEWTLAGVCILGLSRSPCRNYESIGLMMWAITEDTWKKTILTKQIIEK